MSDNIIIPGYNEKNIETINRIMEPKKARLTGIEKQKDTLKSTKAAWLEIKNKSIELQNSAKKLFNYDSPFDEKISESSNENVIRATVVRNASIGEYSIEVKEKASSHRIASDPINKKESIPKGDYSFKIGKEIINFSFSGESLQNLVDEIKKTSKNNLKATIKNDSATTSILILESGKTGEENRISFNNENTEKFLRRYGFITEGDRFEQKISINKNNTTFIKNDYPESNYPNTPNIVDDKLYIKSYKTFKVDMKNIPYKEGLTLEINFQNIINNESEDENNDNNKEDLSNDVVTKDSATNTTKNGEGGVSLKRSGDILIDGIFLKGESPILDIPEKTTINEDKKQDKEELVDDITVKQPIDEIKIDTAVLKIVTDKRTIELPELDISENEKVLKFNISELINKDEKITALIFQNPNKDSELIAGNILFYDKSNPDGINYKREISAPKDALIYIDGIEIKRATNLIDDVIRGVTLNVMNTSSKEESIKVDINYEKIVATIMDFLETYNSLLEMINKYTKFSSEPKSKDDNIERPFLFGDQSLSQLTSRLRTIVMNSYPTSYGAELSLLSNIGISTNATGGFGEINVSKISSGGLLEVNESLFIGMMEKYPSGVKELFGNSINGNMIVDSGVAYEIDNLLKQYVIRSTGIFDSKQRIVDAQIKNKDKEIANYKTKMENEEKKLKEQFYKMEQALKELQENSKKFDNFNRQN